MLNTRIPKWKRSIFSRPPVPFCSLPPRPHSSCFILISLVPLVASGRLFSFSRHRVSLRRVNESLLDDAKASLLARRPPPARDVLRIRKRLQRTLPNHTMRKARDFACRTRRWIQLRSAPLAMRIRHSVDVSKVRHFVRPMAEAISCDKHSHCRVASHHRCQCYCNAGALCVLYILAIFPFFPFARCTRSAAEEQGANTKT